MLKSLVLLALLLGEIALLKLLPATTSRIVFTDTPDTPLARGRFEVGPLVYDVMAYSIDPTLDVYRHFMLQHCPRLAGVNAGVCISETLADRFPEDTPAKEWVEATYDPTAVLRAHLAGAPGDCVTRSALAATALLAAGIPARVVQLQTRDALGHYAFEVLDDDTWRLVDPTSGSSHVSAAMLLTRSEGDRGERHRAPANSPMLASLYTGALYQGMALYPEPWLYTRTGAKHAAWPFRATFVATGTSVLWLRAKLAVQWVALPITALLTFMRLLMKRRSR